MARARRRPVRTLCGVSLRLPEARGSGTLSLSRDRLTVHVANASSVCRARVLARRPRRARCTPDNYCHVRSARHILRRRHQRLGRLCTQWRLEHFHHDRPDQPDDRRLVPHLCPHVWHVDGRRRGRGRSARTLHVALPPFRPDCRRSVECRLARECIVAANRPQCAKRIADLH
jgi:hypothetical protein